MTLAEYATELEKSRKPGDLAVARYIRAHETRLSLWVNEYSVRMNKADKEDLMQVALLACHEVVTAPDADAAILNVRNAMSRMARAGAAWNTRKAYSVSGTDESPNNHEES